MEQIIVTFYANNTCTQSSKHARIANFCGSVNESRFLRDSNNRRYLCFQIDDIDGDALSRIDMFAQRVKKYIGAYIAEMGGCDIVLFTGGIGENAWFMRHPILENMECLGIKVDMELNDKTAGEDGVISTPDSPVAAIVVTTDEEYVIASDTYNLVK